MERGHQHANLVRLASRVMTALVIGTDLAWRISAVCRQAVLMDDQISMHHSRSTKLS